MDTTETRFPTTLASSRAPVSERTLEIIRSRRGFWFARRRGWLVLRALAFTDAVGLVLSFLCAELLFGNGQQQGILNTSTETLLFLAVVPVWLVVASLYGLYSRDQQRPDHTTSDDIVGVLHMITMGTWVFAGLAWLLGFAAPSMPKLLSFWGIAIVLLPLGRVAARAFCRGRLAYVQNTLVYGGGYVARDVARRFLHHPEYGVNLVGFVAPDSAEHPRTSNGVPMLGTPERLRDIVRIFDIDRVVVAQPAEPPERVVEQIRSLSDLGVHVDIVPTLYDVVTPRVDVHAVEGLSLLGLPPFGLSLTQHRLKRAMDVVISLVALLFLAPLFALLALLIKLDSPGPVFFRQVRMGAREKPFQILKLRTMAADADSRKTEFAHLNRHASPGGDPRMFKIDGDPRLTRVGGFLRAYSLDELPQLVNVLKGEMTLVGPRPLILDEDRYVTGRARRRLDLKPGMTGLWQVLGRNAIPFGDMIKLDYMYVTTWSPWHDFRLMLRTVPLVLKGTVKGY